MNATPSQVKLGYIIIYVVDATAAVKFEGDAFLAIATRLVCKRPTNPILASLVSLVAGVFRSPNFFRGRSWSGQNNGGGVFLRISSGQG